MRLDDVTPPFPTSLADPELLAVYMYSVQKENKGNLCLLEIYGVDRMDKRKLIVDTGQHI